MAEAMELDLSLNQPEKNPPENPIVPPIDAGNLKFQDNNTLPQKYTIQNYYKNDSLGSDVLKQKYLAPWEEHPYQLWTRQASALASVEKLSLIHI